jgi:uncharacterized membrane protein YcaP (DUF421 family)
METLARFFSDVAGAGKETKDLDPGEMAVRALAIYLAALLLLRLGDKRRMGRGSPFDIVVAIVLGSVFSRAINGIAPFLATLAAAGILVLLHWVIAFASFRSRALARIVKGGSRTLVRNGALLREDLARSRISDDDLRVEGGVQTVRIELAG